MFKKNFSDLDLQDKVIINNNLRRLSILFDEDNIFDDDFDFIELKHSIRKIVEILESDNGI